MATDVSVKYTPSLNMSVTVKDGFVTKVTTWVTGVPRSTEQVVREVPLSGSVQGRRVSARSRITR